MSRKTVSELEEELLRDLVNIRAAAHRLSLYETVKKVDESLALAGPEVAVRRSGRTQRLPR